MARTNQVEGVPFIGTYPHKNVLTTCSNERYKKPCGRLWTFVSLAFSAMESALLCLGGFLAGCCCASQGGASRAGRSSAISAAKRGRELRGAQGSTPKSGGASPSSSRQNEGMLERARSALATFSGIGGIQQEASGRSLQQTRQENWRGRIWSLKLGPGASTSVEARFCDDGAHWIVTMKDRGPSLDVKAVLLTEDGSHELEHDWGQSFHGQTPLVQGTAVLQLHFRNQHASFSERNLEVKMFLFRAGARIGEHSFVKTAMLSWATELVHSTFLTRDVKLKAAHLNVVEIERVMHDQLWDRYVKTRKEIMMQLSRESQEHFSHAATHAEMLTNEHVPLPLSKAANEHWLFHGTSASNIMAIFEDGFDDNHQLTHGSAFGAGIYFTECSSKADMYASPAEHTDVHDHGGLCCMLLCRVTLGRARKLDSEFHIDTAKLKADMQTGQYHSVLADRQRLFASYREFVTPASQTYPEFLIWYERQNKSGVQLWKEKQWGGDLF